MEQFKKLKDTFDQLTKAINKVQTAKTQSEVNAADSEIGACLRSLQYGIGMVGIECKQEVSARKRSLLVAPAPAATSSPKERKETIVEKAKKAARKKKGSK